MTKIQWMVKHNVAANLLMIVIILFGFVAMNNIKQEVFPDISLNQINVQVSYPTASPLEIETGILTSIESSLQGVIGVDSISSVAKEGLGNVFIKILDGFDNNKVLQDVNNAIDNITTFPEKAKSPKISLQENKQLAISLMLYGNQDPFIIDNYAKKIKDDLLAFDEINNVELSNKLSKEINIYITNTIMRKYDLTLQDIANKIANYNVYLPAGGIKASSGEILLLSGQKNTEGFDYHKIPIITSKDGTIITLSDIANIQDKFGEEDQIELYNNMPSKEILIYSVGNASPIDIANQVKKFTKAYNFNKNLSLDIFEDKSKVFKDRIDLLVKNAIMGLILVLIILTIFLDIELALWVMLGLPISVIGSFALLYFTGATINMVSLFAFIITLGIVVDDAIIVGEAVFHKRQEGHSHLNAALLGISEMVMPVSFAVITNMVAFMPLMFVPGVMGDIFRQIPSVVICVLAISLIESVFILPAHLAHTRSFVNYLSGFTKIQKRINQKFDLVLEYYGNKIFSVLFVQNINILALAIGVFIIFTGFIKSGGIGFSFLPKIDRETVIVNAELELGVPIEKSKEIMNKIISVMPNKTNSELKGVYSSIGVNGSGTHNIRIKVNLDARHENFKGGVNFANDWRKNTNNITDIKNITLSGRIANRNDAPIQIELQHKDSEILEKAAIRLASMLSEISGVTEINNGINLGKKQISLKHNSQIESSDLNMSDVAKQVRDNIYGVEVDRFIRDDDEIVVMLRTPKESRNNVSFLDNMFIANSSMEFIPLSTLINIEYGRSYTDIKRENGNRVLKVSAAQDDDIGNLNDSINYIKNTTINKLQREFPALSYSFSGEEKSRNESLTFLKQAFLIALICIYMLLAIPFNSYLQPLSVMASVPFGIIGAVIGHILLGLDISIISLIGIIGLTGIVINDSLVLIVTLNRELETTSNKVQAAVSASVRRLRPILLTSITTFFGLIPMLFETSVQARFLIPMAVSIAFGVLFATLIILILTPCIYLTLSDLKSFFTGHENDDTKSLT